MTKSMMLTFFLLLLSVVGTYAGTQRANLAFVANVDGNWDLFTVEEDGNNLCR